MHSAMHLDEERLVRATDWNHAHSAFITVAFNIKGKYTFRWTDFNISLNNEHIQHPESVAYHPLYNLFFNPGLIQTGRYIW